MYWSVDGVAGQLGTSNKAITLLTGKLVSDLEETNRDEVTQAKPFAL